VPQPLDKKQLAKSESRDACIIKEEIHKRETPETVSVIIVVMGMVMMVIIRTG